MIRIKFRPGDRLKIWQAPEPALVGRVALVVSISAEVIVLEFDRPFEPASRSTWQRSQSKRLTLTLPAPDWDLKLVGGVDLDLESINTDD